MEEDLWAAASQKMEEERANSLMDETDICYEEYINIFRL